MKRRRHTPLQSFRKLREAERVLAEGAEIPEVAKALEISEQTFHRWRNQSFARSARTLAVAASAVIRFAPSGPV